MSCYLTETIHVKYTSETDISQKITSKQFILNKIFI